MHRQVHLFQNVKLDVKDYEKLNISELSGKLDVCELGTKAVIDKYMKQNCGPPPLK